MIRAPRARRLREMSGGEEPTAGIISSGVLLSIILEEIHMTPEGKVKHKIKLVLDSYGAYYHMPVLNGMGKPSLDFVCCYRGRFFAIEAKGAGQSMTLRQEATQAEMEKAGATVFKVSNKEEMMVVVNWIEGIKNERD